MSTLRRFVSPLAALLAVLIVGQTTDLLACADESVAARSSETHADVLANGGHPVPVPGGSHDDEHEHEEGTFADCLCHVVFAPTAVLPEVGARPAPEPAPFVYVADGLPEVEPLGLDHVPLS